VPIANDDSFAMSEGGTLATNGVLENDFDAENDPLTAQLVSDVSHGTLSLLSNGEFIYTHDGSETTSDSFTYNVNDEQETSNIATVSITINSINDLPQTISDSYNVDEGGSIDTATDVSLVGVLDNDSDAEGSTLTAVLVSDVSQGTLSLLTNGEFTYVHDSSESVTDSFIYVANDGIEDSRLTQVTITINPTNDAPVANDDTASVAEGGIVDITVTTDDTDAETSVDVTTVTVASSPSNGGVSVNPTTGVITYTHDGSETTSDSFTYTVADTDGATSNEATVSITINAGNDAPQTISDSYNVDKGGTIDTSSDVSLVSVLDNDSDAEGSTLTASLIGDVSHGSLSFGSDGNFVYTHDGGEDEIDSFTYVASDSISNSVVTSVTILIGTSLDTTPPVITVPENITVDVPGAESTIVTYLGESAIDDVDGIVPVSCTPTSGSTFSLGETIVTCTASDSAKNTASEIFSITVSLLPTPGKVTAGGAQIDKDVNFGFNIQSEDGIDFKGQLQYNDKASDIKLHSDEMTLLSVNPANTQAIFTGTASIDQQSGFTFIITVQDNGEPGTNDFFSITIFDSGGSSIYQKDGTLKKGNIQTHE